MFATRTARILVVEDHDFMRRSYKTFFQLEDDIEVEWMVETGEKPRRSSARINRILPSSTWICRTWTDRT